MSAASPARPLVIDVRKAFDAGIGTYIRAVVPRVVDRLAWPRVILLDNAGQDRWFEQASSSKVTRLTLRSAPLSIGEQREMRRALPGDAVFWATSLAHPIFAPRLQTLVATVHDVAQLALGREGGVTPWIRWASRAYMTSLRRRAASMFFVSRFSRDEFSARVGEPRAAQVVVTPLGVEPAWFSALPQPSQGLPSRPYIACVGSLRPHKNIARLIGSFQAAMASLPCDLLIVGKPDPDRPIAAPDAVADNAAHRIVFTGQVSDAHLRALIANAQALVFPSMYEGFGLPAIEAMAAGCPVLAATGSALPEVCGDAALYVDPRSSADIARGLMQITRLGADDRADLVRRGRLRAQEFSWDRTAESTAHALQRVLEG